MKTIAIVVSLLLLVQGKEFQRLQEILDYDASSVGEGNCQSDAEYTETLASYDGWIDLAGMGQLEQDEDLDVLEEAQQHIVDVRAILIGIQDSIKEAGTIPDFEPAVADPDGVQPESDDEDSEEELAGKNSAEETDNGAQGQSAGEESSVSSSESESESEGEQTGQTDQPSGQNEVQKAGGTGVRKLRKGKRIVKKVHHEGRHRIQKAQASFVQVITKITHSKIKQQMERIISMVQSLDVDQADNQDQDLIEKVKLCDLILAELDELIKGLTALRYDEAFYNKTLETLNNGKKALLKSIKDCGPNVSDDNQDTSSSEEDENNEKGEGESGEETEKPEDDHELGNDDDGEEAQENEEEDQTEDTDNQQNPSTDPVVDNSNNQTNADDQGEEADSESDSESESGTHLRKSHHHHKKGKGHRHVKTVQVRRPKHHGEVSFLQIGQQYGEDMDLINSEILKQQSQILQNQGVIGFLRNSPRRVTFY